MRVVVTGGAGFLGSHLCDHLIARGDDVVCIDNFSTGTWSNVAHLREHQGFTLVEHDVSNYVDIAGAVDAVLHFASPASPIDYSKMPIQTLKVGSLGTHNTLGLARRKGRRSCWRRLQRSMATRWSTRKWSSTGATSIPLDLAASTTRRSVSLRQSRWPIAGITTLTLG